MSRGRSSSSTLGRFGGGYGDGGSVTSAPPPVSTPILPPGRSGLGATVAGPTPIAPLPNDPRLASQRGHPRLIARTELAATIAIGAQTTLDFTSTLRRYISTYRDAERWRCVAVHLAHSNAQPPPWTLDSMAARSFTLPWDGALHRGVVYPVDVPLPDDWDGDFIITATNQTTAVSTAWFTVWFSPEVG